VIFGSSGLGVRTGGALLLALALTVASIPQAAAAEPAATQPRRTFKEALRTFAGDGRYLFTFPARASRKGVWRTAGAVVATALAMNRDEEIRANVVESDRPAAGRTATKFEPLGRIEVEAAALGTLYLAGRATRNDRVAGPAATAFEAYVWAAVITSVAKGAFGRESPGRGTTPHAATGAGPVPAAGWRAAIPLPIARPRAAPATTSDAQCRSSCTVESPMSAATG